MGVEQGLLALIGAADVGGYEIEQSLRFNSADSAYLNRTPSGSGSTTTWTISCWVKRAALGSAQMIWSAGTTNVTYLTFNADDTLKLRNGSGNADLITTQKFRDPSAWYHIVVRWDTTNGTSADRIIFYINGTELVPGDFGTHDDAGASEASNWNTAVVHNFGRYTATSGFYFGGYLAEVNFIDGSALDHADFGEFDDNGVWRPIEYAGSYTGNSFYLKFASGDGTDSSGLSNDWTANNFTTSGTGTDVMSDTPTTNWATWLRHPSYSAGLVSDGNLVVSSLGANGFAASSSIGLPSSGKFYYEIKYTSTVQSAAIGLRTFDLSTYFLYLPDGRFNNNGTITSSWAGTWAANDVMGVYYDAGTGVLGFTKNGVDVGNNITVSATEILHFHAGHYNDASVANFGQRAFEYTPPTGYVALNTSNLPAPDIADGSEYFDTVLWTGNQTARTISMNSTFTPDFIWIKNRTSGYNHSLQDIVRGYGPSTKLNSNTTAQENAANTEPQAGYVDSVAAGSFDIDASATATWYHNNLNSNAYVGWCWDAGGSGSSNTDGSITSTVSANPTAGFSIVTYTGTGVNSTVGHGLGVQPSFYVVKPRSYANNWPCWHKDLTSDGYYIHLNYSLKQDLATAVWNGTGPSSTVFNIGTNTNVNQLDATFVAYVFAEVEGYSKISSWAGNGSTDGPFVHCGFRPAFLLLKNYRGGSETDWIIQDSTRSTYNVVDDIFRANTSQAEASGNSNYYVDFLSNGFKIRTSSAAWNESGSDYLFLAFAENPFGGSGVSPATAR